MNRLVHSGLNVGWVMLAIADIGLIGADSGRPASSKFYRNSQTSLVFLSEAKAKQENRTLFDEIISGRLVMVNDFGTAIFKSIHEQFCITASFCRRSTSDQHIPEIYIHLHADDLHRQAAITSACVLILYIGWLLWFGNSRMVHESTETRVATF